VLGVLPAGAPGEIQELRLSIPISQQSIPLDKIIVSSPVKLRSADFTQFAIETAEHQSGRWMLFSDSQGNPIGGRQALFRALPNAP
jgi:hypothetical protein